MDEEAGGLALRQQGLGRFGAAGGDEDSGEEGGERRQDRQEAVGDGFGASLKTRAVSWGKVEGITASTATPCDTRPGQHISH